MKKQRGKTMNTPSPEQIKAAVEMILNDPVKKAAFMSSLKQLTDTVNQFGTTLKEANLSLEQARKIFEKVEGGRKLGEMALLAAKAQVERPGWPGAAPGCHEADPAGAAEGVPMGRATGSQVDQPPGDAKAERPSR